LIDIKDGKNLESKSDTKTKVIKDAFHQARVIKTSESKRNIQ